MLRLVLIGIFCGSVGGGIMNKLDTLILFMFFAVLGAIAYIWLFYLVLWMSEVI